MSDCPKWPDHGHNWLQGGFVWWRAWHKFKPWRRYRECVACGAREYR